MLRFFLFPFWFFFSRYTILLHFVTDWYKIFPIKTICHTCYFFVSPLFDFFFHLSLLLRFFSSLPDFFQDIQSCCSLSQKGTPKSLYKLFVALVTFFFCTFYFCFFLCMVVLHLVTDWYKIFPIKKHLSLLLRFFFFPFWFFFKIYSLVTLCYRLIQNSLYKNHLSHLLHFFFFPFWFFFKDIQSCCSLLQKDTPLSLYITICRTCYAFFLHLLIFFFFLCMVLLHLVTDWYKIFPIKTICRSCYAFFSSLPEFFSRYAVLLHLVTDWYKLFPIKTICRSCYAFFFFPSWFFFKICSLVAVCHRRIHHNLYIKPFVALVTFFFLHLIFFSFYVWSCCTLLQTDTNYSL